MTQNGPLLYEALRGAEITETESRMVVSRVEGRTERGAAV